MERLAAAHIRVLGAAKLQRILGAWATYVRILRKRVKDFETKLCGISPAAACFSAWSRRTAARRGAAHARKQDAKHQELQLSMILAERDALLESNASYQEQLIAAQAMLHSAGLSLEKPQLGANTAT